MVKMEKEKKGERELGDGKERVGGERRERDRSWKSWRRRRKERGKKRERKEV